MSESQDPRSPAKEGGLKPTAAPEPSDAGLSKSGGGKARDAEAANDIERDDSPGGRDGGMIGEG